MALTDNEIVQALNGCINSYTKCSECPFLDEICDGETCADVAFRYALDLINRQKADIERLNRMYLTVCESLDKAEKQISTAKAEAIKEFAERLKEKAETEPYDEVDPSGKVFHYEYQTVDVDDIEDLVKEMVGEGE